VPDPRRALKILVVFVHPLRDSFLGQVRDEFIAGAREAGHTIELADLYREGFNPVLGAEDYRQFERKPMPADVLREQQRIEDADAFVLVFPIFWWSFPAMLKGWFDRVWSAGWAYASTEHTESILPERPCVVLCSAGNPDRPDDKYRFRETFEHLLRVGTMSFCGVTDVRLRIFFDIDRYGDSAVKSAHLREARALGRATFGRLADGARP
jgi:NAD(P)H dehydrogenase (quinone)